MADATWKNGEDNLCPAVKNIAALGKDVIVKHQPYVPLRKWTKLHLPHDVHTLGDKVILPKSIDNGIWIFVILKDNPEILYLLKDNKTVHGLPQDVLQKPAPGFGHSSILSDKDYIFQQQLRTPIDI